MALCCRAEPCDAARRDAMSCGDRGTARLWLSHAPPSFLPLTTKTRRLARSQLRAPVARGHSRTTVMPYLYLYLVSVSTPPLGRCRRSSGSPTRGRRPCCPCADHAEALATAEYNDFPNAQWCSLPIPLTVAASHPLCRLLCCAGQLARSYEVEPNLAWMSNRVWFKIAVGAPQHFRVFVV